MALLVKLTSKAWSLKILALLHSGIAGRQAPLLAATTASRGAFIASLNHLTQLDLVEKTPGHGHPLRPEFKLTEDGAVAAAMASRILELAPGEAAFGVIRRCWAVPILAVTQNPTRFSTLKSDLGKVTDRALSTALAGLEGQNWIRRDINTLHRPPYPTYQAVNVGRAINQVISSAH